MDFKLFFRNAEVSLLTRLNGYLGPKVTANPVRHPWLFEFESVSKWNLAGHFMKGLQSLLAIKIASDSLGKFEIVEGQKIEII